MDFCEKLKMLREKKSLSQNSLAKLIGVTSRTIISYEQGASQPRNKDIYLKLAEIFDVDVSYLLSDEDEFILKAKEQYGYTGAKQAQELVNELTGLFAGGEIDVDDMEVLAKAVQDAYWIAKQNNKKYTPKKYRKNE